LILLTSTTFTASKTSTTPLS